MRTYVKKILITLLILVSSAMLGSILLILVYCLPTDRITRHVASGVETFLTEGTTFEYASGYKSAILDNVTDAIMLGETVFPATQDPVTAAMSAPRYLYFDSSSPELSLMGYINNNTSERSVATYPRYWHGYLIFLKPFFLFFDFADSRIFHLGLQMILIVTLISLLYRRKLGAIPHPPYPASCSLESGFYRDVYAVLCLLLFIRSVYDHHPLEGGSFIKEYLLF